MEDGGRRAGVVVSQVCEVGFELVAKVGDLGLLDGLCSAFEAMGDAKEVAQWVLGIFGGVVEELGEDALPLLEGFLELFEEDGGELLEESFGFQAWDSVVWVCCLLNGAIRRVAHGVLRRGR